MSHFIRINNRIVVVMNLRKTETKDIKRVLEIYEEGRSSLREDGVDQWQDEGPTLNSLKLDMERGYSYVLEDRGEVLGTLAIVEGVGPTYLKIKGRWLNQRPYITIHRFAVSKSSKNRGFGKLMFHESEQLAKTKGITSIRVDTHNDNLKMNSLLISLGYLYCGIITLDNGDLRNAYHKEVL